MLANKHGFSNGKDLLSDDWQHFNVNSVKLIQARPWASKCKSSKKLFHHEGCNLIRAVEDNAVPSKRLCKILTRFSFTCTGRPCRVGSKLYMQGTCDSDPASISQRRNDQSARSSKVFIPVSQLCLDLSGNNILIEIIKSELLNPFKVWDTFATLETLNDVSEMNILGD